MLPTAGAAARFTAAIPWRVAFGPAAPAAGGGDGGAAGSATIGGAGCCSSAMSLVSLRQRRAVRLPDHRTLSVGALHSSGQQSRRARAEKKRKHDWCGAQSRTTHRRRGTGLSQFSWSSTTQHRLLAHSCIIDSPSEIGFSIGF